MTLAKNMEKELKKESRKKETKRIKYKECEFYWYVMPVAVPLYHLVKTMDDFNEWKYNRMVWNEKIADKVIETVLPKIGDYHDGAIWYSTEWWDTIWYNNAPLRYRKWASKHRNKLKEYIVEEYNPVGFEKIVEEDDYSRGEAWVGFRKI